MPQAEYISTINGKKIYAERAGRTKESGLDIDATLAGLRQVGPLIAGDGIKLEDGASGVRISAYGPTGATGPQGDTGNAGSTGPSGPKGACGPLGFCGPKGACGPLGFCGPKGACGPLGFCGPSGAKGACGPLGYCGPLGACGPKGACGPLGYCGPRGGSGLTGYCGPMGATGARGPSGVTGACGPSGYTGACGPSGAKGNTGSQGVTGFCGPKGCMSSATWPAAAYGNCDHTNVTPTTSDYTIDSWGKSTRAALVLYNIYTTTSVSCRIYVTIKNTTDNVIVALYSAQIQNSTGKEFWGMLWVQPQKAYTVAVRAAATTTCVLKCENQYVTFNA